ncbi:hypothetical protein FB547_105170 [Variovorax beijingensis]|jgi:hypothetical protein|uniref:Uncharacterized protein n=2 Tax=Variovorax TaxID=34072 RepID=A0AAE3Y0Q4_VARPD|nr:MULTISPECIES: hypothetical protein [Variovorax]MDR6427417.1 hypothetical protein [Variovorax paradoxus]MDR6454579.1 hypothetical protein [Variovorax paradoxus]TWD85658.1 hypothetical protein FB547_105170 [Variovorax beijingensis]
MPWVPVSPIRDQRLAGPKRSFVAEIGRLLGRTPILDTAFTTCEVDSGSFAARLQGFGTAVRAAEGTQPAVRPATLSPQAS